MADIQNFQWIHKQAEDAYIILHPETDASIVSAAVSGLTATTVEGALAELYSLINAITDGGVVTGVKGDVESTYRMGDVNITAENIGLGNVDNTSDEDKPVSTATKAAIDAVEAKIPTDTVTSEELLAVELASGASLKFTEDTSLYTYTLGLYNSQGTLLGSLIEVDLPVEQLVMSVTYDGDKKAIIITLENGNSTEIPVADLVDGLATTEDLDNLAKQLTGDETYITNLQEAVTQLQSDVTTASSAAAAAQTDATSALTNAATAQSAAETAQSTADNAATAAATAQTTADAATTAATAAQTTADSAASAASAAQTTADSASSAASTAQSTAETAQSGVDSINTKLAAGVTGSYSAVAVTGGIVTAGQNIIEYWDSGVESSDMLAVGGIAIREV